MMGYVCALLAVRNIKHSKQSYCGLLEMEITADFGADVTLSDGVALQIAESWRDFLELSGDQITSENRTAELYFEEADLDAFLQRLAMWPDLKYVHPLKEHRWSQRVVRSYSPGGYIMEVGERMQQVVFRFLHSGLLCEETVRRMDVPPSYVKSCIREQQAL